jgi:hypothetical protein
MSTAKAMPALSARCARPRLQPLLSAFILAVFCYRGRILREGLYKVEFHTVHGTGTGVIYATAGKLRGGNSAFAFIGSYVDREDGIQVRVSTQRHNPDPAFRPLFGIDNITLTLRGAGNGDMVDFAGTALQLPGVAFTAILTRISD